MELNRLRIALCLCMALLITTGIAVAGITSVDSGVTTYAVEKAVTTGVSAYRYTLPTGTTVIHEMEVLRSLPFFVDISLDGGYFLNTNIDNADMNTSGTGGVVVFEFQNATADRVRFSANVISTMTTLGSITIDMGGWTIVNTNHALASDGGQIKVTVKTFDSNDGSPFDQSAGDGPVLLANAAKGLNASAFGSTSAIIDVAENRKLFLANTDPPVPDTETQDNGAYLAIAYSNYYQYDGNTFTLPLAAKVNLTFTGSMAGITRIYWGNESNYIEPALTCNGTTSTNCINVATGKAYMSIPANNGLINGQAQYFSVRISDLNEVVLQAQSILVTAVLSAGTATDVVGHALLDDTLTTWSLNGTILLSNWNTASPLYNGRLYIWNPSPVAGAVTIHVYTLPTRRATAPFFPASVELTPETGLELGVLEPRSGIIVKVSEIFADPSVDPVPADNANIVLEAVVNAPNCTGFSQVAKFDWSIFATVPMSVQK